MKRLHKWRIVGNGEDESVIITVISSSDTRIDVLSNVRIDVSGNERVTAGL